jgi:hypothetical protein
VHVKPSGEPERDDTGLPPVDIEIPDDARELARDVQAYYREQRARRRYQRRLRLRGSLTRDGLVVPLLVCCLVFALVTGTLLTLFTATSIDNGLPGSTGGRTAAAGTPGLITPADQAPTVQVKVAGQSRAVDSLGPAVLLVAQAGCGCNAAIGQLASLAASRHARAYLVTTPAGLGSAELLARRLGHLQAASDVTGSLYAGYGHAGLTAILVSSQGAVTYAQKLQGSANLPQVLQAGGLAVPAGAGK